MRIISKAKINEFAAKHPDSETSLISWFKAILNTDFQNFTELRKMFPSADLVGKLTVFNISGNKYRLITAIHYNTKMVYIRDILTHVEYNKNKWRE